MPYPRSQRRFVAKREFTDREQSRDSFLNALETPQPVCYDEHGNDVYRALTFYGVGGQGKSALYRHLNNFLEKRANQQTQMVAHASLNFEEGQGKYLNIAEALLKLRLELKRRGGFECPHFDLAFTRYFALSRPGANIREAYPELFRGGSELIDDILLVAGDALSEVPGFGLLLKYGNRLGHWKKEQDDRQGLPLLHDLDSKDQTQLLQDLPSYLGADLVQAQENDPNLRLVVLMDTYEYLWQYTAQRGANYLIDDWVRRLVEDSPGVLFTIFARDRLRWEERDLEWKGLIAQYLLDGLDEEDADKFLSQAGVTEETVRETIIESSIGDTEGKKHACLPFYLDLQLEQYERDKNLDSEILAENYGGSKHQILERFLKPPYTDTIVRKTLEVVAQARFLTRELYQNLVDTFLDATTLTWDELLQYSFVEEQEGQITLHALMREYLQADVEDNNEALFNRVHQWLFEHYDNLATVDDIKAISPKQEAALVEAAYYKETIDASNLGTWLFGRTENFKQAGRYRLIEPLFKHALATVQDTDGIKHPNYSISLNNIAELMKRMGRYEEAEYFYRKAVDIEERLPSEGRPGRVNLLNNFANLLRLRGNDEAERRFYQVQDEVERDPNISLPDYLPVLNNFALFLVDKGDLDVAEPLLRQALEGSGSIYGKRNIDYVTHLNNLAGVLQNMNRHEEAKTLLLKVVATLKRIRDEDHPLCAAALGNLAVSLLELKQSANAEKLLRSAIRIDRKAIREGDTPPEFTSILSNLALTLENTNRYEEAESLYREAIDFTKQNFGELHPSYIVYLNALANLLRRMTRYDEAKAKYEQALNILRSNSNYEHPLEQIIFENYQSLLRDEK